MLIKHLNNIVNPNPTFKFNNQALVCTPSTAETHHLITDALKHNKIEFFTFDIRKQRPVKLAIKYIPTDLDNTDIETDLRQKNLPFIQISRIMSSKGGRKTPTNILILTVPQTAVDDYYNLTDLCLLKVNVTEYIRQDIPQCHRCQRFGHASVMCNRAYRCVRCGGAHEGQPCGAEACKCANCGEGHPSSYRGCRVYLAAKARYLSTPNPTSQLVYNIPQSPPPTIQPNRTQSLPAPIPKTNPWTRTPQLQPDKTKTQAQQDNKNKDKPQTKPTDEQPIDEEGDSLIKTVIKWIKSLNLTNIINVIKDTIIKLKDATDSTDKILIIFDAICKMF